MPSNEGRLKSARFNCPCCGYPTLPERAAYEICVLCWWEDDGQDDLDADEVRGGPNGALSLSAARANFRSHLTKYDHGRDTRIGGADSAPEVQAKRTIMSAFDRLGVLPADASVADLWAEIERAELILTAETYRKIREYETSGGPGGAA
jgi:hypothetical protein